MCQHDHLVFSDGSFMLTCVDCGQAWAALTLRGNALDYTLKAKPVNPGREGRHDRFVLPRTSKT